VSLVHESFIGVLKRRFVSTYFDTYRSPGYDADGEAYIKGKSVRYGAIFFPDDKLLVSFGFDVQGVYRAFA
jgi:hypothetical protein